MVIRLNPQEQSVWHDTRTLQIGLGRKRAVIGQITPAQERLIAALYQGIADQHLHDFAAGLGLKQSETQTVLEALGPLLETPVETNGKAKPPLISADYVQSAFAEIIRASLNTGSDGERVLAMRGLRKVFIDDLAGAGLTLALGLAAAGVGKIFTTDNSSVQVENLGPSGYVQQLLGRPKIDAVNSLLAASPNQSEAILIDENVSRNFDAVDCAILIGQQVIQPKRYARWLNRDIPHLAITFSSHRVFISPMILASQSACLLCLEHFKANEDSRWPIIASQLIGRKQKFDDAASSMFGAGLALQKCLATLDAWAGFQIESKNSTGYELDLETGEVTAVTWPVADGCDCQG